MAGFLIREAPYARSQRSRSSGFHCAQSYRPQLDPLSPLERVTNPEVGERVRLECRAHQAFKCTDAWLCVGTHGRCAGPRGGMCESDGPGRDAAEGGGAKMVYRGEAGLDIALAEGLRMEVLHPGVELATSGGSTTTRSWCGSRTGECRFCYRGTSPRR
jgi:hypothetical protein